MENEQPRRIVLPRQAQKEDPTPPRLFETSGTFPSEYVRAALGEIELPEDTSTQEVA